MDIRALLGAKTRPAVVRDGTRLDARSVKMQLLKCAVTSTVITQGNAALPHFKASRMRSAWSPNREQASLVYETLAEQLNESQTDSRLGYYQGGYFQREERQFATKDANTGASLAGTSEKFTSGYLELPKGLMDESLPSSAASEQCLGKAMPPMWGSVLSRAPSRTPKSAGKVKVANVVIAGSAPPNKTISRLLTRVNPDLRLDTPQRAKSQCCSQPSEERVGRTAGSRSLRSRSRPIHSRPCSSTQGKPQHTERILVTGVPLVYQAIPSLYEKAKPRPKSAFPRHSSSANSDLRISQSVLGNQRLSAGTDLDALMDSFSPQLLKPRYQTRNSTPKAELKMIDVKIPTPKFRPATVQLAAPPGDATVDEVKHRRSATIVATQGHISEWSIRITPKSEERKSRAMSQSAVVEERKTEDTPVTNPAQDSPAPLISATFSIRSIPPSAAPNPTETSPTPPLEPQNLTDLNTSLAITVLKPRSSLSSADPRRRHTAENQTLVKAYLASFRQPQPNHLFFEEQINAQARGQRPKSGVTAGRVVKGRAKLESAKSQGRVVRGFRLGS